MSDVNKVATAMLREVPVHNISSLLAHAGHGGTAMGDGCGGGCGGGAGCIDKFGHSGLTNEEIQTALKDKAGIATALKRELTTVAGKIG
jgi:hypothetical protein